MYFILAGGLLLRLIPFLDPCLHDWDEKFHALVAKNMVGDLFTPTLYKEALLPYSYQNWTANHIWLHKQPLALWVISGSIQLLGESTTAVRLPSMLMSTSCIFFTYKIGTVLFSQKIALWASAFLAINGFVVEITGGRIATDHVDVIFFFVILLGILWMLILDDNTHTSYAYAIKTSVIIGFITGLAVLCKWMTGFILLPLFVLINLEKPFLFLKIFIFCLTSLIVFIPWQIFAISHFPLEYWHELEFNTSRHLTEVLEGHQGSWFYFLDKARINWNELIYFPVGWLLYEIVFRKNREREKIFLFIWIAIPYIIFSIAKTKMPGYVLFTAPAVFITAAYFIFEVLPKVNPRLATLFLILFLALAVRYSLERIKPFKEDLTCVNKRAEIDSIKSFLKSNFQDKKTVIFNAPNNIELMFFADQLAYSKMPSKEEIRMLTENKFSVLIIGDKVPIDISSLPGVIVFNPTVKM